MPPDFSKAKTPYEIGAATGQGTLTTTPQGGVSYQSTGGIPVGLRGTVTPYAPGTAPLSSETMTNNPAIEPVTTNPPPPPDVSGIVTPTPTTTTPEPVSPFTDQVSKLFDEVTAGNSALAGQTSYRNQQNEAQGVNQLSDTITGLNSQLTGLINESKAIPLQIQQQAQGQGVTAGGMAPIQTAALRNNAIQSLSVSSQIDALGGQLANAMKKVDRALAIKYGDLEEANRIKMQNLELLLKDPRLTIEEKKRAEFQAAKLKKEEQAIADAKAVETAKHDAVLKALNEFQGNPKLTDTVIAALNAAKSDIEVAMILQHQGILPITTGGFELSPGQARYDANGKLIAERAPLKTQTGGTISEGGATVTGTATRDAQSVMSGAMNLQDISVKDNHRAVVAAELKKLQETALKSGDIIGAMRASAAYDKEPSDTFLQSMEKTMTVADQLGTLQQNIVNEKTGPLLGAFRNANPWDTQAQVIKAQLNAIVPNLARGVYGEVGVLTDNDIKQYAKTIPTLTSTEDIRNAILYITLDQIKKNLETKIKNQIAAQRDMSGYINLLPNISSQIDSVLAALPKQSTQVPANDEFSAWLKSNNL